jgi:membrane protease YdiL (CAAX protease family)
VVIGDVQYARDRDGPAPLGILPPMAATAVRRGAAAPALLCVGLAAAVVLRIGVAGGEGPRSVAAGTLFGAALLGLAVASGWRPGRLSLRSALIGAGGAAVLLAVPLALHLRALPLQAGSPAGDFAVWAVVVSLVACAEEALLRGALMGSLLRRGVRPEAAVAIAAVAFAALHVPLYGWTALPLDLAVGVWLGGLRLLSGGAGAPAVAHTLADLASWWLR